MSTYFGWGAHAAVVLVASFAAIAISCALWAIVAQARGGALKRMLRHERARMKVEISHRDALLNNGMQGIVIMKGESHEWQYFGSGKLLFELIQETADAPNIASAIDVLVREAKSFTSTIPAHDGVIALRGQIVGGRAVLYLCEQRIIDDRRKYPDILRRAEANGRATPVPQTDILNSVPLALAVFDSDQILRQYNDAYAQLWGLSGAWLNTQPSLADILNGLREKRKLPEQRQFGEWLKIQTDGFAGQGDTIEDIWHLPDGRSVRILMRRQPGGGRLFVFRDVSDVLRLETSFNLLTQVQKATLDTLDEGVAIFGTDGRLVLHNGIFAGMWRLTDGELAPQPHFTEIADLCAMRIGRDAIWEVVAEGISSTALERFREWSKLRRADDRIISLSLSRLPNGATLARFTDMTDLEKFTAIQSDASGAAA